MAEWLFEGILTVNISFEIEAEDEDKARDKMEDIEVVVYSGNGSLYGLVGISGDVIHGTTMFNSDECYPEVNLAQEDAG